MAVEFFTDHTGQLCYQEKPLIMDPEYTQKLAQLMKNHESRSNGGWSKDRTLKFAGSIPREVWFNAIQASGNDEYWTENRGAKMKQWLNDHEYFRVGGKFIRGGK